MPGAANCVVSSGETIAVAALKEGTLDPHARTSLDRTARGRTGEQLAAFFLCERGYLVLAQNQRTPLGELDLICRSLSEVVVVEVKSRSSEEYGMPSRPSVRGRQRRLRAAAAWWLADRGLLPCPVRFDAVIVIMDGRGGPCSLHHLRTSWRRDRGYGLRVVWGFALVGIEAVPVRVEAHARNGLPGVTIVGLPGAAVREARERIRSGAASSDLALPTRRITINLSPGDVPKEGPGFDLPVALATLAACGYLPADCLRDIGAVGEVSLEGAVRPTRGVLSVAEAASALGVALLITPIEGLPAAAEVSKVPVVGVRSLSEAVMVARDPRLRARVVERGRRWIASRGRPRGWGRGHGRSRRCCRPPPSEAGAGDRSGRSAPSVDGRGPRGGKDHVGSQAGRHSAPSQPRRGRRSD